jgi:hypothetical protein
MKKTFLGVLALLAFGISCKKSGSTTDPAPSVKFMSLDAGNTWDYQITNNLTSTSTTNKVISTSKDSSIGGKNYHVFTNSNGAANTYYNITGSDYWTFANLGLAGSGLTVENIYLKDNAAVNDSWDKSLTVPVTGFPNGIPVTFTNKIAAKGISRTVSGKAYTEVIHVTTTAVVQGLPAGSLTTDIQSYYAPKVGLIESKNKISLPLFTIDVDQTTILKATNF